MFTPCSLLAVCDWYSTNQEKITPKPVCNFRLIHHATNFLIHTVTVITSAGKTFERIFHPLVSMPSCPTSIISLLPLGSGAKQMGVG